jgi:hypothetical protein
MRRTRFTSRSRQHADADTLIKLAKRMAESGTRLEDQLWERRLIDLINDRLARGQEDAINAALDELAGQQARAYDDLADLAESCAESALLDIDGRPHDALVLAIPVLAWSRYKLPCQILSPEVVDNLAVQLGAHVLAGGARCVVANQLYSIDQLPETFGEVRDMAEALFGAGLANGRLAVDPQALREPVAMLADSRYVLAAVIVPQGTALFHWQETGVDPDAKTAAVQAFAEQAQQVLAPLMTGCHYRVLSPNAFHAGLRLADRDLREFSMAAAVAYLKLTYDIAPASLQAIMAIYEEKRGQPNGEIRIGISRHGDDEMVIEGIVWPLLGDDEDRSLEEVEASLKRLGIVRVTSHDHRFPLEYCDDCGAPVFPNVAGHSVHAEPPEPDASSPGISPLH